MTFQILLVEDDEDISSGLSWSLQKEGFEITVESDGESGYYRLKNDTWDLAILDIMMPFMSGLEVLSEIRKLGETIPIIMLSAKTSVQDKVMALNMGADDYVTKPFDTDELVARIKTRLKDKSKKSYSFGKWAWDELNRTLLDTEKNHPIILPEKESKMLSHLIRRKQVIVNRETLLVSVWGEEYEGTDRVVDNSIVKLRKIIGSKHIATIRGKGYKFMT